MPRPSTLRQTPSPAAARGRQDEKHLIPASACTANTSKHGAISVSERRVTDHVLGAARTDKRASKIPVCGEFCSEYLWGNRRVVASDVSLL